jgi:Mn2+/Fe2+ NRAMP family transporter
VGGQWKKQWEQFSKTNAGKAVQLLAIFLFIYSGLAARLLYILVVAFWLAPLLLGPILYLLNKKVGLTSS